MILEILAIFILLYLIWFYFENFGQNRKRPPGPIRIPPFGNLIQLGLMDTRPHIAVHKMAKEYGPVMSIKMGLSETVIFSTQECIKQIYAKEEATGRDCTGYIFDRNLHEPKNGLAFSEGPANHANRKFCLETLKIYGFGNRESVRNMLLDELTEFMKLMEHESRSNTEHTIHFNSEYFHLLFLNIMATLVVGKRYNYDDSELQTILKHERDFVKHGIQGAGLIVAYPFLRHIIPKLLNYDTQLGGIRGFQTVARNILNEKRKGKYDTNPSCFTDHFLQKMDEKSLKNQAMFTEDNFAVLFTDIIQGGTATTSNVTNFVFLHLAANQEIQAKVYQEILDVVGPNQPPNLHQRTLMPYTHAVILEAIRWTRIAPLNVPRKVLKDFTYKNYCFKKGMVLLFNMHTLFFDEEFWGDPEIFRPERFLDLNRKFVTKYVDTVQFGFGGGKRSCLGEAMARDSLFIITTTLIQKFKFSLPPGSKPTLEIRVGLTSSPYPYDAIVTLRTHI